MAFRIFRRFPLKVCLIFVILCLALKENFPFSHFPMYESFSDYSFVIYIADRDGEPLPIQAITSYKTSKLKKIFKDEQEEERERLEAQGVKIEGYRFMTAEQRRSAGEKTLEWLFRKSKRKGRPQLDAAAPLRVYYVHLRMGDEGFEKQIEFIAEMAAPND